MEIPGPSGWESIRQIGALRRDPLRALLDMRARYGDLVHYRYGSVSRVLVGDPQAAWRILVENQANYNKDSPFYHMLKWFLGEGLVTADGDLWRAHRRLAQPAFSRSRLEGWLPMVERCSQAAVERWRALSRIDLAEELILLTLQVVGLTLFSQDLSHHGHEIGRAVREYQLQMAWRFRALVPLPPVFPTRADRRFRALRRQIRQRVGALAQERAAQAHRPDDLLTSLLEARDPETGQGLSTPQLCDELVTFLLAGYETVASNLVWTFYLLSRHPEVRTRLEAELDGGQGLSPLSERVILESLRLYPPVCVYGRRSLGPDVLSGYPIPARQIVSVSPFLLHRHPGSWDNPEGFEPDRFLQPPPRGAFAPFALGPRQCIGSHFAVLEARLILETVTRQVRLNLVSGARIEPEALITLQPRWGMPMTVHPRGPLPAGPKPPHHE